MPNKLEAFTVFDEELDTWVVYVKLDGEELMVGRTIDEESEIFEYDKFESRDIAEKWILSHSKFYLAGQENNTQISKLVI